MSTNLLSELDTIQVRAHQVMRDFAIERDRLIENVSKHEFGQVRVLREQAVQVAESGKMLAEVVKHLAAQVSVLSRMVGEPILVPDYPAVAPVAERHLREDLRAAMPEGAPASPAPRHEGTEICSDPTCLMCSSWREELLSAGRVLSRYYPEMARAAGLEPATPGLEGRCSDPAELRPPAEQSTTHKSDCGCRVRTTYHFPSGNNGNGGH